jgi:hypothetical protein
MLMTGRQQAHESNLMAHLGNAMPLTRSSLRHRDPTPLSELDDISPIFAVLQHMRVQRMSLVQSLRQYVFVHWAIIHHLFSMLDEEQQFARERSTTSISSAVSQGSGSIGPSASASRASLLAVVHPVSISTQSSSTTLDDDIHSKRRASPTELRPEDEVMFSETALRKRPSFKKMRAGAKSAMFDIASKGGTGLLGVGVRRQRSKHRLRAGSTASSAVSAGSGSSLGGINETKNAEVQVQLSADEGPSVQKTD